MADYTVNPTLNGVDTRQLLRQAQQASNSDVIGNAGFEKALGIAGNVMSLAGPALGAAAPFMGFKGAAITGAAVSAFQGQGGGFSTPGLSTGFGTGISATGKALSMPGTAPGFPGSSGGIPGAAPGYPGGYSSAGGTYGGTSGMDTAQMDSQINAAAAQNAEMLAIQFKMQNVSQMSQMMSNIAKTDSDAKLNAIRNVKA